MVSDSLAIEEGKTDSIPSTNAGSKPHMPVQGRTRVREGLKAAQLSPIRSFRRAQEGEKQVGLTIKCTLQLTCYE